MLSMSFYISNHSQSFIYNSFDRLETTMLLLLELSFSLKMRIDILYVGVMGFIQIIDNQQLNISLHERRERKLWIVAKDAETYI